MIPSQLEQLHRDFWGISHFQFDLTTNEGCGKYTETWVKYAQNHGYSLVGHLRKNPSQTQYNGHANDAFLYADGSDNPGELFQAVDLIGAAESTDPMNPPHINWGVDLPRYTIKDWMKEPGQASNPTTVPYVAYNENGFQRLKKMLAHDYARRPQGADYDVSVWAGRYFHNCYMGPTGTPLGEDGALKRIKPELCASLHIDVDNYYGE